MTARFAIPCLALLLAVSAALGAMSDSKAVTEARKLWGDAAIVATVRCVRTTPQCPYPSSNWTKQIGYASPGCRDAFTIAGSGFNTWDAAFAALPADKGIAGTFSGQTLLVLQSPAIPDPPSTIVISEPIPGIVSGVRVFIDNIPLPALATGQIVQSAWTVSTPWDTTKWTDGFHVVCAQMIHPDGSYIFTAAKMVIVKQ